MQGLKYKAECMQTGKREKERLPISSFLWFLGISNHWLRNGETSRTCSKQVFIDPISSQQKMAALFSREHAEFHELLSQ